METILMIADSPGSTRLNDPSGGILRNWTTILDVEKSFNPEEGLYDPPFSKLYLITVILRYQIIGFKRNIAFDNIRVPSYAIRVNDEDVSDRFSLYRELTPGNSLIPRTSGKIVIQTKVFLQTRKIVNIYIDPIRICNYCLAIGTIDYMTTRWVISMLN